MLTATLRKLETNGLVKRKVYPTITLKVEYKLTELDIEILSMVEHVNLWTKDNPLVIQARSKIRF